MQLRNKYFLGHYLVDSEKYIVSRDNESIHLPELPFQVLLYLIENRERYVSREELLKRFWQGSDSYEETLTKCISTIRTSLSDPPASPIYIETRKKVGYRYIGPCEVVAVTSEQVAPAQIEIERHREVSIVVEEDDDRLQDLDRRLLPAARRFSLTNLALIVLTGSLLIIGILLYVRWHSSTSKNEPVHIDSIAVLPLRNLSGNPNEDYFSDGITESLITSLSRIEGLSVQSRSSVFRFKNKDIDLQGLGNQLGVAAVLVTVTDFDQSNSDSHRLIHSAHTAFQNSSNTQLISETLQIDVLIFESKNGAARLHAKTFDARK